VSETARALHAIRVAELEAARRVEQARADAAESIAAARREHERAVADARLRGRTDARRRFDAAVAEAEREAEAVLAGCDARVESLRCAAEPYLATAVTEMVDLLLAPPLEEGK
jgi:vacuolar-type H+-ATPase subunit H